MKKNNNFPFDLLIQEMLVALAYCFLNKAGKEAETLVPVVHIPASSALLWGCAPYSRIPCEQHHSMETLASLEE